MIDDLTKKELKEQLALNGISFSSSATAEALREVLRIAIDTGKAELKQTDGEEDEATESEENVSTDDEAEAGTADEADSSVDTDDVVLDTPVIQDEKQVDLMTCMRQNMGLPPFADKWED